MSSPFPRPARILALPLLVVACGGDGGSTEPAPRFPVAAIAAGDVHTCALAEDGTYCWGLNRHGTLGDSGTMSRPLPTRVATGVAFVSLEPGAEHTCALTAAGEAWCWGENFDGGVGDGTDVDRQHPVRVATTLRFRMLAAANRTTCGLTSDGVAHCWGWGSVGQLGGGAPVVTQLLPRPVAGDARFASISAGSYHFCGLTAAGEAYCWGNNSSGALGDGTVTNRSEPTPVATALRFRAIDGGQFHTCGVTTGGAAYCWGANADGQLGDGSRVQRLLPTLVLGDHEWEAIGAGVHSCGLTTGGGVHCWGTNATGQGGTGQLSSTPLLEPTAVAGSRAYDVLTVGLSHACARAGDAAFCWGSNGYGQLGNPGAASAPSPTPVQRP